MVVIEVESEDDCSNWDCEIVVLILLNLDNYFGKIVVLSKFWCKVFMLGKVLEDKEVIGGIIKFWGKVSLLIDFFFLRF